MQLSKVVLYIVKVVDNVANGKGVDATLEVLSIGGVVGHKGMSVMDLASFPFDEGWQFFNMSQELGRS